MRNVHTISVLAALTLAGCATVPPQIAGTDFAPLTPKQVASPVGYRDAEVDPLIAEFLRWAC